MENIAEAIELRLEPVADDLIVDDESIVMELGLEVTPLHRAAARANGPSNGPSSAADPRPAQGVGRQARRVQ